MSKCRALAVGVLLGAALFGVAAAEPIDELPPPPAMPTREEPTALQKTGDLLILRPLLAVRLVAGVAALPLAWPMAALLGDSDWAIEACVREPGHRLLGIPVGRL